MKRLVLRGLVLLAAGGMTQAKAADFAYAPGAYTVNQPLD